MTTIAGNLRCGNLRSDCVSGRVPLAHESSDNPSSSCMVGGDIANLKAAQMLPDAAGPVTAIRATVRPRRVLRKNLSQVSVHRSCRDAFTRRRMAQRSRLCCRPPSDRPSDRPIDRPSSAGADRSTPCLVPENVGLLRTPSQKRAAGQIPSSGGLIVQRTFWKVEPPIARMKHR